MNNITKRDVVLVIAGIIVGVLFSAVFVQLKPASVGGVYSNVIKDFSEGISVDGTVVIDGNGNIDAPITSSTGTFSGTLDVTGAFTGTSGAFSTTLSVTGDATFDTSTLFVDASGNKVGFGTTSPTALLTVGSTTPTHLTSVNQYKSGYINGELEVDGESWFDGIFHASSTALFTDAVRMFSTLIVDGATTLSTTLGVTGATTLSTLSVTGATTLSGEVTMLESSFSTSTDLTLTNADSGTTIYIDTTGATSTLPAVITATSTVFRFVVASAFATDHAVILSAEGDNIEGALIVNGAVVECAGEDKISFIVDGENVGDYVEIRSDGQNWLIGASGGLTAGKLTCTDPN